MAGKRPDQHNIDPSEGRATDHKTMPQSGQGNSNLVDSVTGDRQRLEQARAEDRDDMPFLPDVPSPSAEANRAANRRQVESEEQSDMDEENRDS